MFRKNTSYQQQGLFGVSQQLTKKQQELWATSIEHSFFEQIFCKIDEDRFSILYSDKSSRPNVPVNQLVGSLILKHLFDWTYDELFKHLSFNLLTRHAIGIDSMDTEVYAEASLFNFQNRLIKHFSESGEDLLMEVFDKLTSAQLKQFGVSCEIQRGDSFLIGSNIMDYNRLQLVIEMLKRLYRALNKKDQQAYQDSLAAYLDKTSGQYIYRVKKQEIESELHTLGRLYQKLVQELAPGYAQVHTYQLFCRVYTEHFCVVSEQVEVRPSKELHSGILMSPDDPEATYRDKRSKTSKGYVGHLSETANLDNPLQLITDITVEPNNVGDAELLEKRLPAMLEKTPDIKEYFTDGQYGGPGVDKLMAPNNIKQYHSGIRGRTSYGGLRIYQKSDGSLWVRCNGGQDVKAVKRRGWSASFDFSICAQCPLAEKCNTRISGVKKGKPKRTWYFQQKHILSHLRFNNFETLPDEKKTLRASVESTVRQMQYGMRNGKVRVRTRQRVAAYMSLTAIATNLKRVHAYLLENATIVSKSMLQALFNLLATMIQHQRKSVLSPQLKANLPVPCNRQTQLLYITSECGAF